MKDREREREREKERENERERERESRRDREKGGSHFKQTFRKLRILKFSLLLKQTNKN